jgi:hypothetical protein
MREIRGRYKILAGKQTHTTLMFETMMGGQYENGKRIRSDERLFGCVKPPSVKVKTMF